MSKGDFTELEDFPRVINTSNVDFVEDSYNPLLSRSIEYKRGVGFFRASWIRSAARGMANLAENGGKAKWLTSPILSEDDWEMIKKADKAKRDQILYESLQDDIDDLRYDLKYDTRNADTNSTPSHSPDSLQSTSDDSRYRSRTNFDARWNMLQ